MELSWGIIILYKKIRKKEGMGLGDAKLLAVIGFWFGWASIPFVLFSSSNCALISVIPSLLNKIKNISSEIPFGTFFNIRMFIVFIFYE